MLQDTQEPMLRIMLFNVNFRRLLPLRNHLLFFFVDLLNGSEISCFSTNITQISIFLATSLVICWSKLYKDGICSKIIPDNIQMTNIWLMFGSSNRPTNPALRLNRISFARIVTWEFGVVNVSLLDRCKLRFHLFVCIY